MVIGVNGMRGLYTWDWVGFWLIEIVELRGRFWFSYIGERVLDRVRRAVALDGSAREGGCIVSCHV